MATTSRKRSPGIRLTAAERRDAIVEAAVHEFALGGFDGTSAAVIALRAAFLSLPQKRTLLLLQLHAFAACEDLDVRAVTRAEFAEMRRVLALASGTPECLVRSVLAEQALVIVAAAMDLPEAWS